MKIGVFDSGLGGLFILRSLVRELPRYDYMYLGDTARVPYGNRPRAEITRFLEEAVAFLFARDCELIIVACNTASAQALRTIQQKYIPKHYPGRRALGVIIPTVEAALGEPRSARAKVSRSARRVPLPLRIGVLATQATVRSRTYEREAKKLSLGTKVFSQAAPLLVPLIERDAAAQAAPIVAGYLKPLMRHKPDKIILGCTHYVVLKSMIARMAGVPVISQDEVIPKKVREYLRRHTEITSRLGKHGTRELLVTKITAANERLAREWFADERAAATKKARLKKVTL